MSGSRRDFIRSSLLGALALPLGAAYHADTRNDVVLAPRLREGATIGLVSPAGAIFDPSRAELVRETLADLGYQSRLGRNALRRRGYLAGSDEARASDLYDMFADDTIDAIVALRGGWGITRMLPHLDMSVIRRNPKIIMGYSDITALLLAIYARTG
ncbi:MAG: LD-carboxypeptidase, partial [Bacteroidota bacterium]